MSKPYKISKEDYLKRQLEYIKIIDIEDLRDMVHVGVDMLEKDELLKIENIIFTTHTEYEQFETMPLLDGEGRGVEPVEFID